MTKEKYAEYLTSPHWITTRQSALERAEHRCQVCNRSGRLDVHHRTYERVGAERDSDLTVLCRGCHEHFHGISTGKPRKLARRISKDNWSQLPDLEKEQLMNELLDLLCRNGPMTSKQLASLVGRRTQVIGSALVHARRRGFARKLNNRWKVAA